MLFFFLSSLLLVVHEERVCSTIGVRYLYT